MQFKTFQGKTHTVRTATSLDNPQQSVFAELFKRANANNPQMKADILRAIVRDIMWTQNGAVPSPSEVDAKIASVAPITFKQGSGKEVIAQTDSVSTTIELPKRFGAGVALKLAAPFIFAAEAIPLALSGIGAYLLISYAEPAAAYACMAATEPFVAYGTLKGMKYTVQKLFTSKKEKIASDIICEVEKAMNNPVVGAGADLQYELPLPNSNNRGTTGAAASESTQNEAVPPGLSTNLFGDSTGSAPAAMAPGLEQKIRAEAARMSIDPDLAVKVYVHALEQNGLISFQDSASSLNVS